MRYHRWRESAGRIRSGTDWLFGAVRFAYAYPYFYSNSYRNRDIYTYAYGDIHAYSYGYCYIHAYRHIYADSNGHSHVYSNGYSNGNIYAYPNANGRNVPIRSQPGSDRNPACHHRYRQSLR